MNLRRLRVILACIVLVETAVVLMAVAINLFVPILRFDPFWVLVGLLIASACAVKWGEWHDDEPPAPPRG